MIGGSQYNNKQDWLKMEQSFKKVKKINTVSTVSMFLFKAEW